MKNVINIRPAARNSDPSTSHKADKDITLDGTKEKQLQQVYKAVKQWRNCTSREIAEFAGLDRHMVGRRLPEDSRIKHNGESHKKKCQFSGRLALTWDLI